MFGDRRHETVRFHACLIVRRRFGCGTESKAAAGKQPIADPAAKSGTADSGRDQD